MIAYSSLVFRFADVVRLLRDRVIELGFGKSVEQARFSLFHDHVYQILGCLQTFSMSASVRAEDVKSRRNDGSFANSIACR